MRTKIQLLLIFFLFGKICICQVPQLYEDACFRNVGAPITPATYLSGEGCKGINGYAHTPLGNLHILYIIVDLAGAIPDNQSSWWPESGIPNYAALAGASNDILDIDPTIPTNRNNLTTWYRTMSANNFSITGEIFKVTIADNQPDFSQMTNDVFASLSALNRDWSKFDQRQNNPNWLYNNNLYNSTGGAAGASSFMASLISSINNAFSLVSVSAFT